MAINFREINDVVFTLTEYQKKRDEICKSHNIDIMKLSRGLSITYYKKEFYTKKKICMEFITD